jgi:PAS domain S-box-containing protein
MFHGHCGFNCGGTITIQYGLVQDRPRHAHSLNSSRLHKKHTLPAGRACSPSYSLPEWWKTSRIGHTYINSLTGLMQESEHIPDWSLVQQYMRASPSIFFYWAAEIDWPVRYVSENINQLGYRAEEFITGGKKFSEIVHPEDLARVTQEVEEYTAKKLKSFTQEYRVLTGEGDTCWIDDRTVIQCDAEGEVTHYLGIITDITKEKNAETALKLSQEKYRTLVETTEDFVWEVDRSGIYTYCSPQVETLLGHRPEDMLGKTPFDFMTAEDAEMIAGKFSEIVGKEQAFSLLENTNLHCDGSEVVLESSGVPFFDADGRLAGYRGIDRNITVRKRAEEELRLAASVFENVSEGILITDVAGTIQSVNTAYKTITQLSEEELIGKNPRVLQSGRHDPQFYKQMWASIRGSGHWQGEIWNRRSNGEIFPQWLTINAIKDRRGRTTNYVGVAWDVSDLKASQRMKEEFITTISHELRTPLTSVLVSLGMLKTNMQEQLPEQAQKLITLAHSNSRRLVRLISDILDIEKIEAGKMTFHFEPLELITLVRRVVEDSKVLAEAAQISLSCRTLSTDDWIKGDADRLMQALTNLLSNAIKYSPPGESVEVMVQEHGAMLRIAVTDHGPGIPLEFQDQIFRKFAQVEQPDSGEKAGTGLGLSIAKLIVQKHNGQIDFQSKPGVGTVFFIDLPRAESRGAP